MSAAREALDALALRPPAASACRGRATLDAAELKRRREGARRARPARPTARPGARTGARARTTTRATRSSLLDDLLDRFGAAYDAAKAERAGVDFDDLELRARDLLADTATRAVAGPSGSS